MPKIRRRVAPVKPQRKIQPVAASVARTSLPNAVKTEIVPSKLSSHGHSTTTILPLRTARLETPAGRSIAATGIAGTIIPTGVKPNRNAASLTTVVPAKVRRPPASVTAIPSVPPAQDPVRHRHK